ncbi:MAG: DUF1045 domain-containing protein [Pseudomonadota bacterium]
MRYSRFALYFTCPPGALADAGSAWLGWDIAQGQSVPHPATPKEAARLTERPRKYGFHATLKPPFRLAPGANKEGLHDMLRSFAAQQAPMTLPALTVRQIGRFVALVPAAPSPALQDLAAACVTHFESCRAPLTEDDLARRRAGTLSARQEELLVTYGYPYVLDEFRFHMTLTGPLDEPEPVAAALQTHFAPVVPEPFVIDAVSLCGERDDGRFDAIDRVPLTG